MKQKGNVYVVTKRRSKDEEFQEHIVFPAAVEGKHDDGNAENEEVSVENDKANTDDKMQEDVEEKPNCIKTRSMKRQDALISHSERQAIVLQKYSGPSDAAIFTLNMFRLNV